MIRNEVIRLLLDRKIISGLANCHVPGLYSLVFRERTTNNKGMLRLFYCAGDALVNDFKENDFSLLPHNHRQDLTFYGLTGDAVNNVCDFKGDMWTAYQYRFVSGLLNDDFKTEIQGVTKFNFKYTKFPKDGSGIYMPSEIFHTVRANKGDSWIVDEGTYHGPETACLSFQEDLNLSKDNLYLPMNPAWIEAVRRAILMELGKLSDVVLV